MQIKVKYDEGMEPITQAHEGEWYDLRAAEDVTLWAGDSYSISLGVAMELPKGYEAIVAARSSLFKNYGLIMVNGIGVIDNAYCGNNDIWHFPVFKLTGEPITIHKNDRIAQFRLLYNTPSQTEIVTVDSLTNSNRGGFGSTGVK